MDKRRQPRLSLDLLRGFRAAARHLSFTRAAQELFVTQSAISREIRTLEERLGQPLFHRVHRALKLTRAGEELFRVAEEALTELDAVIDRLGGSGKTLSITTTSRISTVINSMSRFGSSRRGLTLPKAIGSSPARAFRPVRRRWRATRRIPSGRPRTLRTTC